MAADEIVSGTFRSIAGILSSVDSKAGTITVTDLATKQPVTVQVTSDSQLRKLQPFVAQGIAMRLKGAPPASKPDSGNAAGNSTVPATTGGGIGRGGSGPGANGQGRAGDFQQTIARMPAASLTDLQKGDAVMIVATEGSANSPSTVITLLGGVEPILQAGSKAAQDMILSPWSLSGGGGEGATP